MSDKYFVVMEVLDEDHCVGGSGDPFYCVQECDEAGVMARLAEYGYQRRGGPGGNTYRTVSRIIVGREIVPAPEKVVEKWNLGRQR